MTIRATYVHTNLVAADWRGLATFYQELFGCVRVPPERDYRGAALDAGTGLAGAHLRGAHLRLPGRGDGGPTLEIFTYDPLAERGATAVNRPGFGHIAFEVDDVGAARKAVLEVGGSAVGEVVTLQTASGAEVTWCYVTDPEGNILELQSWLAGAGAGDAEQTGERDMIDTTRIDEWLARYLSAWASDDPEEIAGLFTVDVRYFTAPYRDAISGRDAVIAWWRAEKESQIPWTFEYEVIAREGDRHVVGGITRYPQGEGGVGHAEVFRNLWLIRVGDEGRASEFIEYWMLVE